MCVDEMKNNIVFGLRYETVVECGVFVYFDYTWQPCSILIRVLGDHPIGG